MRSLVSLIAVGALASMPAFAQIMKSDQKIDNDDAAAMKQLAQANLNEIEAGKAAAARAQNPQVKQFAQKMVDDHTQMLNDLKALAQRKSVSLPDAMSLKDKAQMELMKRAAGADFDKRYMDAMVKDHQEDLQEVQDLAAKAKDPDFRAAVQRASSRINEHLQLAQRIATSSAAGATTPSNSTQQVNPGINYSK
jgi:putative membrane protein